MEKTYVENEGDLFKETRAVLDQAAEAVEREHRMSLLDAVRLYPKAIMWSVLLSLALVMEGYDIVLLSSFYAFPSFLEKFGVEQADGTFVISAAWQSGLSNGALVGEIGGLIIGGYAVERFGYRKTMLGSLVAISAFIFVQFFASGIIVLQVAYILVGFPWGVFQSITTSYAADVCPVALRCYLTTYVNLCWVLGQFIASGVLKGMLSWESKWSWRVPYAIQWFWPIPIFVSVSLAPESPWWLVRHNKIDEAKAAIRRLVSDPDFDVDMQVAMITQTNAMEARVSEGTSFIDCFKGTDLRRTEIVSVVYCVQSLCGCSLMGYSTYFYEQAGLATSMSFTMSLIQYAIGAVGTISSWFLLLRFGRRTLYLFGIGTALVLMLIIGIIGSVPQTTGTSWAIGSMLLVFTAIYDCTIGPLCYSIVAEIPSTRLRPKSIVVARTAYNIVNLVTNIITPYMLNPTAWNWKAKAGYFWAGYDILLFAWAFFKLPEPKGLAYNEIDILFEKGVSARRFQSVHVQGFAAEDDLSDKATAELAEHA
ncbi:general substrate transporter [Limtongia smithiae]|uniref:general substrate transporter n=1 Tax=Limtongia smithiae TaxID=1125753 RepID=UPI0034CE107A